MKQSFRRALGFCSFLSVTLGSTVAFAAAPADQTRHGKVQTVVDGDTIRFATTSGAEPLKVRLIGIDAPESHFPTPNGPVVGQHPFGDEATEALKSMVPDGKEIELVDFGLDKFNRTLGRLVYKGVDLNLKMVEAGMAVPYMYCVADGCTQEFFTRYSVAEYVQACESAQKAGRGIFNPKSPLKELPYDFRRRLNHHPQSSLVGNFKTKTLYNPEATDKVPVCRRVFFISKDDAHRVGYR